METPKEFWAADCGDTWVECDSKDQAINESSQYMRKPHAMRMRRMKLSELIARRVNSMNLDGWPIAEALSESDGDVAWCYNHEADPLGEDVGEEELQAIAEAGLRGMMEEADWRGLVCDGCVLLEDAYGE